MDTWRYRAYRSTFLCKNAVVTLLAAWLAGSSTAAPAAEPAYARDQIRVVGSSTVFPFTTAVAEFFGRDTHYKTPVIESTGTGGGIKLFCEGVGARFPDMADASRPIKPAEIQMCKDNGVMNIVELTIGFDGIVLANALHSPTLALSRHDLFLALARQIPRDGALIDNPYATWHEVNPSLPDSPIRVYGPPPTSGTRDAFSELVMDEGCKHIPEYAATYTDPETMKQHCSMLREDGAYIEAGENDNLIVQKLIANPETLGIFGYSFLDQNASHVKANPINDVMPSFETIASGEYSVARSLLVYVKAQHQDIVPGLHDFARALVSDEAVGEDGYAVAKGLIPLPAPEHAAMKQRAETLAPLTIP